MSRLNLANQSSTPVASVSGRDLFPTENGWNTHDRDGNGVLLSRADGWNEIVDTWAYASANTITVPSGAVSIYTVGSRIRIKQGGGFKYFAIVGVTDTLLTVTGGTDYTVANSTITDISYGNVATPLGYPNWFNYTPDYSCSGSMTFTSVTTKWAKFCIIGNLCNVEVMAEGTLGGTMSNTIYVSAPLESEESISGYYPYISAGLSISSILTLGFAHLRDYTGEKICVRKYDASNMSAGTTLVSAYGGYSYAV